MAVSIQVISHHPAESRPAYQARAVTSIFVRSQQRRLLQINFCGVCFKLLFGIHIKPG